MEIRLSPELAAKIEGAVSSGRYRSVDEYIAEAVATLEERPRWHYETAEELNALLEEGLADAETGNLISMRQLQEEMQEMKAEWARSRQTS